jgi:hypothetical protein
MEQEKILKLFEKFVGGVIDLHGLKCIPVSVGEFGTPHSSIKEFYPIQFKLKNPNDVPYYSPIVGEELFEIVEEFSEYVNLNLESEVLLGGKSKLYLSDEVQDEIQKVFDSVREIKFTTGTPFIGYKKWVINIESIGLKTTYFDEDSYYINNTVVPISATKNDKNVDVNEAINTYIDEFLPRSETYYETEEYYQGVDQVISRYPLLNENYVATYYDTKFIR